VTLNKKQTAELYNQHAQHWAKLIRGNNNPYHSYLEKPAMYSKVPNLNNKKVLCLGCGSGEEVAYLSTLKPQKIIGVDISEKLVEIAKKNYPHLEFKVIDIEELNFPENSFDFVYSSLTLHYLESWAKVLKKVRDILTPQGTFLFSITSPFFSALAKSEDEQVKTRLFGYKDYKQQNTYEIFGDYLTPHEREVPISQTLVVQNYHRPFSQIFADIKQSGLTIIDIVEPKAIIEAKKNNPKFWEIHQKITEFMIFELQKQL